MKTTFFKKIFEIIILAIFLFLAVFLLIFKNNTENSNYYLKAYDDKKLRLINLQNEKKIIFIGGSNLAFGLNSYEIDKTFKEYKIINFGLHAGIGIKYILNEVKNYIQEGDILIIVPEYENFYNSGVGDINLWRVVGLQKNFKNLDFFYLLNFPNILDIYICFLDFKALNNDYGKKFTYDRRGFNEYGDYEEHWKYESKKNIKPSTITENKLSTIFIKDFKNDIENIKNKNIGVYLLPPVYQESSYIENREKIYEIEKNLGKFAEKVEEYVYSDRLFFDSSYHLNKEGVEKRTKQIIKFLEKNI